MSLDDLAGINFAALFIEPAYQPAHEFEAALRTATMQYGRAQDDIFLAGIFLESVRLAAEKKAVTPSEALGFVLSEKGNWRIQRDFAAHATRYFDGDFAGHLRHFQTQPDTATTTRESYEGVIQSMYTAMITVIGNLRQPLFREQTLGAYHAAHGREMFREPDVGLYRRAAEQLRPETLRM
ncbi:MAG: hypothetical protein Q7R76_04625 [Candidatus Woesearchaeota archaeon]|nr:hypothetical protein [Candidatus Woesearchaeota archaeon]